VQLHRGSSCIYPTTSKKLVLRSCCERSRRIRSAPGRQRPHGLDAITCHPGRRNDGGRKLLAHVSRASPLWKETSEGDKCSSFFELATPTYRRLVPSKHEAIGKFPTWNYCVVHVYGRMYVRDDERSCAVSSSTDRTHEVRNGSPKPWKMTDSSPEYIAR